MPRPVVTSQRPRGRPPKANRADIVDAALAIVDDVGVQRLTIRGLAAAMGMSAAGLYTYVNSVDDVVVAVCERVLEQVDLSTDTTAPWTMQLKAVCRATRTQLLRHPAVLGYFHNPSATSRQWVILERMLEICVDAGLAVDEALDLCRMLAGHIGASVLGSHPRLNVELIRTSRKPKNPFPPKDFPVLSTLPTDMRAFDHDGFFDSALDIVLEHFDRRLAAKKSNRGRPREHARPRRAGRSIG